MAAKRARRSVPASWSRYAAPAAFLLAATVAVLLVRSALHSSPAAAPPGTTAAAVAKPKPKPAATAKRKPNPPTTTAASTAQTYVVQAGDTFGAIAAREGTTVEELERLNPGVASTSLHVGQEIRVR